MTHLDRIASFMEALLEGHDDEESFDRAMTTHPDIGSSVVGRLRERFVDGRPTHPLEALDVFWRTLVLILSQAGDGPREELLARVLVEEQEAYYRLAPLVRSVVRAAEVEDLIVDKLRHGTPLEQHNARDLEVYLFGSGGPDYQMSPPARAEFDAFAARLERAGDPRSKGA